MEPILHILGPVTERVVGPHRYYARLMANVGQTRALANVSAKWSTQAGTGLKIVVDKFANDILKL